mgnify:CR=1 FL=1
MQFRKLINKINKIYFENYSNLSCYKNLLVKQI